MAGAGPAGVFAPSNLVKRGDGYLYALVRVQDPGRLGGSCLIRSRRISAAGSWRAWTGERFAGTFTDPYQSPSLPRTDCALIAPGDIAEMTESLTFNVPLQLYFLLGMAPSPERGAGAQGSGIYYSVSRDLIHWSQRRLLSAAPTVHSYRCGGPSPIAYPSLVDPRSSSRTFATTGPHAYLYYTQFHYRDCRKTQERDLIRVPVEISP
jgi:hypothetical protein